MQVRDGGGAGWTCPSDGMWGGWDKGGMMGGHEWDASYMWGAGHVAAWLANHPRAFGRWLDMRAEQTVAHITAPRSTPSTPSTTFR